MKNKPEIVYVVDDDEAVRDSLTWLLESNGYVVKCLPSAERFLQSLSGDNRDNVACLILDVRMPGMSGLELQERLMAEGIPMPISFITGHGDVSMAVSTMKKGAVDFIEKPFKSDRLLLQVRHALDAARLKRENQELKFRAGADYELIGNSQYQRFFLMAL